VSAAAASAPEPRLPEADRLALERAVAEWNAGRFFECHDTLEAAWQGLRGPPRDLFQGLIQAAVGFHHMGNGNRAGARTMFGRAIIRLAPYPERCAGLELGALRDALREWLERTGERGPLPAPPRLRLRR
jgi:hypothetical protein